MSTLRVDNLNARTGTKITVPTGTSLYAPGGVVQVQSNTYTAYYSTTSHGGSGGSGVNSPLTVSITPSSINSKIFVLCNAMPAFYSGQATWLGRIVRTGSATAYSPSTTNTYYSGWSAQAYIGTQGVGMLPTAVIQWIDTPGSLSTTTYTLQICGNNTGIAIGINGSDIYNYSAYGGISTITVMEIGV